MIRKLVEWFMRSTGREKPDRPAIEVLAGLLPLMTAILAIMAVAVAVPRPRLTWYIRCWLRVKGYTRYCRVRLVGY